MTTTSFASATLDRREVVAHLIQRVPQVLAVAGLGSSTYDLYAAGDRDRAHLAIDPIVNLHQLLLERRAQLGRCRVVCLVDLGKRHGHSLRAARAVCFVRVLRLVNVTRAASCPARSDTTSTWSSVTVRW